MSHDALIRAAIRYGAGRQSDPKAAALLEDLATQFEDLRRENARLVLAPPLLLVRLAQLRESLESNESLLPDEDVHDLLRLLEHLCT